MNALTEYQTIMQDGRPAFVVIPYAEFVRAFPKARFHGGVPHEVVALMVDKDISRLRAWREYLGLTQDEAATAAGIKQPALAQMEKTGKRLQKATLEKLARTLDLHPDQFQ